MTKAEDIVKDEDYQFGFHDNVEPKFSTGRGLTEEVVRQISAEKHEPKWMLDYRLKAFHIYEKMPIPDFGPDLSRPYNLMCKDEQFLKVNQNWV